MKPDFRLTIEDLCGSESHPSCRSAPDSSLESDMVKNLTLPNHAGHLRRAELSQAILNLNEVSEKLDSLSLSKQADQAVEILESLAEKL